MKIIDDDDQCMQKIKNMMKLLMLKKQSQTLKHFCH